MNKVWTATITVKVAEISAKQFRKYPKHYRSYFKDFSNPTEAEVSAYCKTMQEDFVAWGRARSAMLNAPLLIEAVEV